ncbi:universal stress protein [Magnetococcales bacterium HHB-1]
MMVNQSDQVSDKRFRVLVCIDGSDESYRSLRYAIRLGAGLDADITLLYVRKTDQGLQSGGLQVRVARENILKWKLELPGIKYLKKGRDLLIEMGHMESDWEERTTHSEVMGDPLGDHMIEYCNQAGRKIRLRLKVAPNIESGILEQREYGKHNLIMLGAFTRPRTNPGVTNLLGLTPIAGKVAVNAPCSVLISRELEEGKGHLICVDGSEATLDLVRKDALIANKCACPITLLSVARTEEERNKASDSIQEAAHILEEMHIPLEQRIIRIGDPVTEICAEGKNHSVIVISGASQKNALQNFFLGSTTQKVMERADTSVLIVR